MSRRAWLVPAVLALLVGCSAQPSADPEDPDPEPSKTALAEGDPASGALQSFTCRADDEGVWSATGVVQNPEKASESYQVAVLISDTEAGNAKATTIESIQPGESSTFQITEVPVSGEDPTCRVTVVRLAS